MTSETTDRALRGRDLARRMSVQKQGQPGCLSRGGPPHPGGCRLRSPTSAWWTWTGSPPSAWWVWTGSSPRLVGVDSTPPPSLVGVDSDSQSQNWPVGPSPPNSQGVTLHMSPPPKQGSLVMKLTSSERVPSFFWWTSHPVWLEPQAPRLQMGVGCAPGRTR